MAVLEEDLSAEIVLFEILSNEVRRGRATQAFQFMKEFINHTQIADGEAPEQHEVVNQFVIDGIKELLTKAIKQNSRCCDSTPEVYEVQDLINCESSLVVHCLHCCHQETIRIGMNQIYVH